MKRVAEHPSRSIGFLSRYHDGELTDAERAAFDRHAAACPECSAAADEYEAVLAMYRESRPEPADPSLARRISRRIDTELRRRPPVRFLALEIDLLWASVAAIGLVAAIALFAVLGRRRPAAIPERAAAARTDSPPAAPAPERFPEGTAAPGAAGAAGRNGPTIARGKPQGSPRVEGGVPAETAGGVSGGNVAAGRPGETADATPQVAPRATELPGSEGAPLRVGGIVSAPVLERRVEPDLPKSARRRLGRSPVVVEAVISAKGDVVSARIVRSNPAADRAVLDALRRWKYRPALLDGRPVPVHLTVTVR